MTPLVERRTFLSLGVAAVAGTSWPAGRDQASAGPLVGIPRQDAGMVEEMVRVAHGNLPRVKELLDGHPALAKAAIDWGFGDWEDALGACSHVGRPDVAEVLLAHGARPTLFSATMLGQLDTVKAFIAAAPGAQRILGPHSLTLMVHARAGGERARAVRDYLEELGDADAGPALEPLDPIARLAYAGSYTFGAAADQRLDIATTAAGGLSIHRPGLPFPRDLRHLGHHEFFPIGAESVRIRFAMVEGRASAVGVFDPAAVVNAMRVA